MVLGIGMFVVLPVVAMLLRHQKFMAELVHRNQTGDAGLHERLGRIEAEMAMLKDRMNSQILHFEEMRRSSSLPPQPEPISERIES
ncbi:MAG: hypothetical protein HZC36_04865 [Armatimonadetes bacterium]|nr:hypothetical protein [Armatimonadota bacterium]